MYLCKVDIIKTIHAYMCPDQKHINLLNKKLHDLLIQCINFSMKAFRQNF